MAGVGDGSSLEELKELLDEAARRTSLPPDGSRDAFLAALAAQLLRLAVPLGLSRRARFESMTRRENEMQHPLVFATRLLRVTRQVCRIELADEDSSETTTPLGTGFLVGEDRVLTNHHVVYPAATRHASRMRARFDYWIEADGTPHPGVTYRFADPWCLDESGPGVNELDVSAAPPGEDELDYALVRLADPVGSEVSDVSGNPRGWIDVPSDPIPLRLGDPLVIVQHPQGGVMQYAKDTDAFLGYVHEGRRLRYRTNTERGSSGSPVFDQFLKLVGLHHVGDPKYHDAKFNQGIPIELIGKRIGRRIGELAPAPSPASRSVDNLVLTIDPTPALPAPDDPARRVFVAYASDDRPTGVRIESILAAFDRSQAVVVRRRVVPAYRDVAYPEDGERLARADIAIIGISDGLLLSTYLKTAEARQLVDRARRGQLTVLAFSSSGAPITSTLLEEASTIHVYESAKELATELPRFITTTPGTIAAEAVTAERADIITAIRGRLERERVPTSAVRYHIEPSKSINRQGRIQSRTRHSLPKLLTSDLKREPIVAVLGDPGSGKSVLLRELAYSQLNVAADGGHAPIPIPLALRGLKNVPLLDAIRQALSETRTQERRLAPLEVIAASTSLMFILDGLDELPRETLARRLGEARQLVKDLPNARVVVSCRRRDFPIDQLDAPCIELEPWSEEDVAVALERGATLAPADANAGAHRLFEPGGEFARDIGNALYVQLLVEYVHANSGELPTRAGEPFDSYLKRLLGDARGDVCRLAYELAQIAGIGGAAVSPILVEQLADRTTIEAGALIAKAQQARILRRDDETGTIAFERVRVHELALAEHLAVAPDVERETWLFEHAAGPWAVEVYLLLARTRRPDMFHALTARVCATTYTLATATPVPEETTFAEHDRRLVLLGRLAEVDAIVGGDAKALADALEAWWPLAERRSLRSQVEWQLLTAARGPVVRTSNSIRRRVLRARYSRLGHLRRASWLSLESADMGSAIVRSVLAQSLTANYLHEFTGDRAFVAAHPQLAFAKLHVITSLVLHILFLAGSTVGIAALASAYGPSWCVGAFIGGWLALHLFGPSWASDGSPSIFVTSVPLVSFVAAAGLGAWLPAYLGEWLAAKLGPARPTGLPALDWTPVASAGFIALVLGLSSTLRRAFRYERALLLGFTFGVAYLIASALVFRSIRPELIGLVIAALVGVVVVFEVLDLKWDRGWRFIGLCFVAGVLHAGGVTPALPLVETIIFWFVVVFYVVVAIVVAYMVGTVLLSNITILVRCLNAEVCDVEEAQGLLQILGTDVLLVSSFHAIVRRLSRMTPRSHIVDALIVEMARSSRWRDSEGVHDALRWTVARQAMPGPFISDDDEIQLLHVLLSAKIVSFPEVETIWVEAARRRDPARAASIDLIRYALAFVTEKQT